MKKSLCALLAVMFCFPCAASEPVTTPVIGEFSAEALAEPLSAIKEAFEAGQKDQNVILTSPGGSIWTGMAAIKLMEGLRARGLVLHCYVDILDASMGAAFLESNACSERIATDRSTILFHSGSTSAEGTETQIRSSLAMLHALNEAMATMISKRLDISIDAYKALTVGDWVLTADDALKAHVVDRVIHSEDLPLFLPVPSLAQ